MNFTNWKKIILLLLVGFSSTLPRNEQESPELTQNDIPQEVIEEHNQFVEHNLQNLLLGFNRLDEMLQELAHLVNNDQIPGLANKRVLIGEIGNLRGIVDSIKNDTHAQANPVHLYLLTKVLDAVTDHIHQAIKDGFHQLPTFNLEATIKRSLDISGIDPATISSSIAAANKKIEDVYQESQSVGLNWYNKAYRKFDNYVIQPLDRYKVPQRTAKVALASALPFLIWFYTDRGVNPETLKKIDLKNKLNGTGSNADKVLEELMKLNPKMTLVDAYKTAFKQAQIPDIVEPTPCYGFEYWLRSKVGPSAHIAGHSDLLTHFHDYPDTQLAALGNMDYSLRKYNSGLMPIGALLLAYTLPSWSAEISNAAGWISKKAQAFHNFMRGGAYKSIKPAQQSSTEIIKLEPRITFDDIVGAKHAIDELSLILEYIKNPEAWDRLRLKLEKGILLTGPTRTGKSFIAEALAGEIRKILKKQNRNSEDFGFYIITGSFIAQNGIKGILEAAKREAPCVLFIDEIDLLSLQRTGDKNMLAEFLTAMSGCMDGDPRRQVIILAATNKSQNLDPALKQEGRFGTEIRFEYPSFEYRKQHLVRSLTNLAVNIDSLEIDRIAHETEGCSFEKLNAIIRYAFQKCKINGCSLTQEILDEAVDAKLRHIILKDAKKLPEHERRIITAHQAGQAFALATQNTGQALAKVTIRPMIEFLKEESVYDDLYKDEDKKQKPIVYGGLFTYHNNDTLNLYSREEKINEIKRYLAGHIAEEILLKSCGFSYCPDNTQKAKKIADSLVAEGLDVDKMSRKQANEFSDQSFALFKQCRTEIRQSLETNKEKLSLIAKHLQERLSLTGAEVHSIITTGALPAAKASKSSLTTSSDATVPAHPETKQPSAKNLAAPALAAAAA